MFSSTEQQQQKERTVEKLLEHWTLDTIRTVRAKLAKSTRMEDVFDPHVEGGRTVLSGSSTLQNIAHWSESMLTSGFRFSAHPNIPTTDVQESRLYQRCLVMTDVPFYVLSDLFRLFNLLSPKVNAIQQVKRFFQSTNSVGYFIVSNKEANTPMSSSQGSLHVCYRRTVDDGSSLPTVVDFPFATIPTRFAAAAGVSDEYLFELEQVLRGMCPLMNDFTFRACKARMQRVFCPEFRFHTYYPLSDQSEIGSESWMKQIEPVNREDYAACYPNIADHHAYMNSVVTYIQRISFMKPFDVADLLPAAVVDMDHLIFLAPIRSVCSMSYLGMQFLPLTLKNYRTKFFQYQSNDMDKTAVCRSLLEKLTRRMSLYVQRYKSLYVWEAVASTSTDMHLAALSDPMYARPPSHVALGVQAMSMEDEEPDCNFLADDS